MSPFPESGLNPSPDERKGLSSSEIKNAFLSAGIGYQNSYLDMYGNPIELFATNAQLIYSYVESGFPVLFCLKRPDGAKVGLSGHVVTSVGHSLPRLEVSPPKEYRDHVSRLCSKLKHIPIGALSTLYYVHDDCYGPYNRLQLCVPKETTQDSKFKIKLGRKQVDYNLQEIIIPVHPRHRCNALVSLWDAQSALDAELEKLQGREGKKLFPEGTIFVWRSFLTESSKFKESVCNRGYTKSLRKRIGTLHLSKYVWVHEYTITTRDDVYDVFPEDVRREIHGEYLYDATSPQNYVHPLAKRNLYGYWWDYSMGLDDEYFIDEEAKAYKCYVRKDMGKKMK